MFDLSYYDGTKLLSMKDINGNTPEIFICVTNRCFGKTTYFARLLINRYFAKGKKFCLLYRFNYELDECADKFFKNIKELFFENCTMTAKKRAKGIYYELFLNDKSCGYATTLNQADNIKKYSHLLSDIETMFMDEFQSENNKYVSNEVQKLISIHTSLARGGGKQVKYLPIYMCSNSVSLINPYFTALGISTRLNDKTKFLKGDGYVVEQGFGEEVSKLQKDSAFNRAFANESYVNYASQNIYLNDNATFIENVEGKNEYFCTLHYKGKNYGIRCYPEQGVIYVNEKADLKFPRRFSVTTDDHNVNYVMIRRNTFYIDQMRYYFDHGCLRFKNLQCKEAFLTSISY